jgi:Pro-kumamolisin, activation domain
MSPKGKSRGKHSGDGKSHALAGSERPRPDTHKLIGALDPGQRIGVTVVVRHRPGAQGPPELDDWAATPRRERRVLSRDEFEREHGADAADLARVEAFAHEHGLEVADSHAGTRAITLEGSVDGLQRAFGVTLNHYEAPLPGGQPSDGKGGKGTGSTATHVHHGYDGPIHLPSELKEVVIGVVGLDNRLLGVPGGAGTPAGDPAGASTLRATTLAQRYNIPNPGASDQTIGVIAPTTQKGPFTAYSANDILNTYFPSQIAGYRTPPTLEDIPLTVSGQQYENNAAAVAAITTANIGENSTVMELTQDISTAATLAQGATVNVYFTENSEQGWLVFLNRVLMPQSEKAPTVVSCSWGLRLGDDSGRVGSLGDSGSLVSLMTAQFKALAAVGVDVFVSAGDWGADNWTPLSAKVAPDGSSHVMYPGSDPWITSCGGTILGTSEETVWSDAFGTTLGSSSNSNFGATGGGVSKTFTTAPTYQSEAGITGAVDSAGTTHTGRGVPDIAGHVALTGMFANKVEFFFTGTSCVAPFYAGVAAVLRSAIGRDLGPLNDTLYALKDVAFNDITSGNNSSQDTPANVAKAIPGYTGKTPNAPFFSAGPGWDACTGLGSVDGTRLLNGVASLLYNPNYYFEVNKGTFGLDEVNIHSTFAEAMWLVVEGFTPDAVAAAGLKPKVQVSIDGVTVEVGAAQPEIKSQTSTPQRVLFPCTVSFSDAARATISEGGVFPESGAPPNPTTVALISSVKIDGRLLSAESTVELEPGADPFFSNYDPSAQNPFCLSQDLRVFTVTPGVNSAPIDGIALNGADPHNWDTAAGYAYIQALLTHLNAAYGDPAGGDAFTHFPDQTNALSGDSSVTPTSIDPSKPTGAGFANYNFAVARVRLNGTPGGSSGANVRVLFRLFTTMTGDTDFSPLTYPSTTDSQGQPLAPQVAPGDVTIPFFATGNYQSNSDFAANHDYSANSVNNQPVTIGPKGETFAYYGCYLNLYPTANKIGATPVQALLAGTHSCLVAQLVYDDAPMPTGAGVLQGPEYSDNFAQRNLQITFSDNPGPPSAHVVPQTFDARPSRTLGSGQLLEYPDELMIDWGAVPAGSVASVYWPQVAATDVLGLAKQLYSTHQLREADEHTIECDVRGSFTFVPIPPGTGENFAGLFTVELPDGVKSGQAFDVTVRRVSTRSTEEKTPPSPRVEEQDAEAVVTRGAVHAMRNWRYIVGTFAVHIPVATSRRILPLELDTLAIMKWRLGQMQPTNRWVPVLKRYIGMIEGRVQGLGGEPWAVEPSPWGAKPAPPTPKGHGRAEEVTYGHGLGLDAATGKVDGIVYDRFGDFEGFLLLTEAGQRRDYFSREAEIEALVRFAWEQRVVISVLTRADEAEVPVNVILRRAPSQPLPPAA